MSCFIFIDPASEFEAADVQRNADAADPAQHAVALLQVPVVLPRERHLEAKAETCKQIELDVHNHSLSVLSGLKRPSADPDTHELIGKSTARSSVSLKNL
jgi:hypothetical protein